MNKNTCPMNRTHLVNQMYPDLTYEALLEKYCAVCKERDELRAVVERVQQYVKRLEEECCHD